LTRKYDSGTSLSQKILEGANILADNVASTLGPKGRNVILQAQGHNPIITKDGVTVAKFVELDDPMQNAGAEIIKQASIETNNVAGDGTTTATVLARALLVRAQAYLTAGASPVELKRGMDKGLEQMLQKIDDLSRPIASASDIEHVATISANGDLTIGKLVAMAVDSVGKDGAITVEEARALETSLDIAEGFQVESGYLSPSFITDERRGTVNYERAYLLVADGTISAVEEMLPVLEVVAREARPLVIVAEDVEGQALAALIMNSMRGSLKVAAIKAPRYGEERRNVLRDLALTTGATFITRENDIRLQDVKLEHLGQCNGVEITKSHTTIVGGNNDYENVERRIEQLKAEFENTESIYECERIQDRITRLASGIAIIRVGASTEVEMIEKKHRIEDALEAVRSARLEGIVPGGGMALIRCAQQLNVTTDNDEQALGVELLRKAVCEPLRQMAINAGKSPDIIQSAAEAMELSNGYNFATGEECDMIQAGIIDPAKVTKCALRNAVSVASTLITTNYAIIQTK